MDSLCKITNNMISSDKMLIFRFGFRALMNRSLTITSVSSARDLCAGTLLRGRLVCQLPDRHLKGLMKIVKAAHRRGPRRLTKWWKDLLVQSAPLSFPTVLRRTRHLVFKWRFQTRGRKLLPNTVSAASDKRRAERGKEETNGEWGSILRWLIVKKKEKKKEQFEFQRERRR